MRSTHPVLTTKPTFWVMYLDIPATPDSFCSVHSSVTCRRTSFFLDAAVTTSAPLDFAVVARAEDAVKAEVLAMFARAVSIVVCVCV